MTTDYLKDNYIHSFSYSSEEHSHKWPDIELDIESVPTISSEDDTGSNYDPQTPTKTKFSNELWKEEQIWENLMVRFFFKYK